jgi:hypothetical protein
MLATMMITENIFYFVVFNSLYSLLLAFPLKTPQKLILEYCVTVPTVTMLTEPRRIGHWRGPLKSKIDSLLNICRFAHSKVMGKTMMHQTERAQSAGSIAVLLES